MRWSAVGLICLALAWPALRAWVKVATAGPPPLLMAPLGPLLAEHTRITSGFGDPRGLRLHAGLDYSTNRARGMPVLAPAGGWVSRVSAEYSGYGLQLMISDSLGRRHLFAHLLRLREDLQAELERVQQERGAYIQLLEPDSGRFAVGAGEVIAWSGDTGNGPPHLHYELRDETGSRCFNPLRHGVAVVDPLPPALEGLALVPLACGATARGSLLPRRLTPVSAGRGRYLLEDTLDCQGPLGLALHAVDHLPGTGARLAPWRIQVVEEGDTLFQLRLDSFPLAFNDQSGRLFERWLQQATGNPWLKLWGGGGSLGLWDGEGMDAGRLRPDQARPLRRLQVLVRDAAENLSVLDLVLRLAPLPERAAAFAPVDSLERAALREKPASPAAKTMRAKRGRHGRKVKHPRKAPSPPPPVPGWILFPLADGLHLRLAPLPASAANVSSPSLTLDGRPLPAWGQLRDKGWEWALTAAQTAGAELRTPDLADVPALRLSGVWLDPERETAWRDAVAPAVVVYADKGAVAEPALLLFKRWRDPAGVFTLGPADLQWERDLTLEISLDQVPEARRGRVALFQANARGLPVGLIGGRRDGDRLVAGVSKAGSYVLFADTRGPAISLHKAPEPTRERGRKRKHRRARVRGYDAQPTLTWEIGGDPSGIANVVLLEEGRRHYPRYEPDTHLVTFRPREAWPAGDHSLELRVIDRSGNESQLASTIRIKPAGP